MTAAPHRFDADVGVIGAGPAGWALAAALQANGLTTMVVAPEPTATWSATYGMWVDEVPEWLVERAGGTSALFASTWPRVRVAGSTERIVDRPYGRLDNDVLRNLLVAGQHVAATVRGVSHSRHGSHLHTTSGVLSVRLVVDATGASSRWQQTPAPQVGAQVAYGLIVPSEMVPEPWRAADVCTLMDWRPVHGAATGTGGGPGDATFLYVLNDGHRALVEETSLVSRPPMALEALRRRLALRLGEDLTQGAQAVERVHIPMAPGRVRHRRSDRVVAFGAAAGYVHPATGYSVTASLRAAPRVAQITAHAWEGDDVDDIARTVAEAVWPLAQRRVRALHDVGLAALQRLDGDATRTFFDAFFSLPAAQWSAYLRVDAAPGEVMTAMAGVFARLPWRVRRGLVAAHPRGMLAAVTGGGS